jgi:hypothetical protein
LPVDGHGEFVHGLKREVRDLFRWRTRSGMVAGGLFWVIPAVPLLLLTESRLAFWPLVIHVVSAVVTIFWVFVESCG